MVFERLELGGFGRPFFARLALRSGIAPRGTLLQIRSSPTRRVTRHSSRVTVFLAPMYAQCPECLTFFHLKPSHLKAAGGRVRCSRCKHVFNALETLRDDLTPDEIAAVQAAKRREPKPDAPLLHDEQVGDLFDGLEFTANAELKLDEPEPYIGDVVGDDPDERDAEEAAQLSAAPGPIMERELQSGQLAAPAREFPGFDTPPRRHRSSWPAAGGVVLLILLLLAQVAHWQRDAILRHDVAGPWLATAYELFNVDLTSPPELSALKISRTEVSSHPDRPRALHLTAVLENRGENAQPWPHLRVDLQDRWGETVGARFFTANEYLRNPALADQSLSARTQHPVSLAIMDPGSAAVGFQVEPCFPVVNAESEARHACVSHLDTR